MKLPSKSNIPSFAKCLRKLIKIFGDEKIDYMFLGGLALPAYGEIRATQDVGVAVAITDEQTLKRLFSKLDKQGFEKTAEPVLKASCMYILDRENLVDVEIWLKPSGIKLDQEVLSKRQRRKISDINIWIIGPEDFIVNKLSRTDRSTRDESDVVSVLIAQREKLDRKYLEKRAKESGVFSLLLAFEDKVEKLERRL